VGALLNRRLPQQLLHVLTSPLFPVFGLWKPFDSALALRPRKLCDGAAAPKFRSPGGHRASSRS
jgi:hypothetical protein